MINENLVPLLIVFTVIGLIGFSLLLFLGFRMLSEERARKEHGGVPLTPEPPAEPKPEGQGLASVTALFERKPRPEANAHEVLRVLRDNLTGRLLVEVVGRRYPSLADIQDPIIQQAFLTALHDLELFAGEASISSQPAQGPAAPGTPGPSVPQASALRPTPGPAAPGSTPSSEPPLLKPSMNPFKQRRILREMEKRPPVQLKTIPEIIDEFLQQKLMGTPLIWRGIRVKADAKGMVLFEVDSQSYERVDDVPDEDVRTLIRAALAEWEKTR
jgi:hypothetical protein